MRAALSAFATKERNVSWPLHRVFRNKRWYNARRIQDLAISEIVRIIFKERKWWRIRTGSLLFYSFKLWIPQNNRTDHYHHHLAAAIWSKIVGLAIFRIIFRERKWWSSCCGNMIEDRQSRNLVRVIVREKKMRKNTNGKRYSTSSSSEFSRTIAEIIVIILPQQYDLRSLVSQSSLSE
jgi:hypothetical protein